MLLMLVAGCTEEPQTPENRIRQFIEQAILAAENRDVGALADLIAQQYIDDKNLNKDTLTKMARGYFFRHRNIHLLSRIDSISLTRQADATGRASLIVYIAMAGQPLHSMQAITTMRARLYRFDLILVEQNNDWLLLSANWKPVKINEFFGH
ncbi:MAG: hypothetical protein OQL06_10790 [Gammaproteobacteria bacterium]|nr:hypothetical protein [Gammaproteobacteria bacterium]